MTLLLYDLCFIIIIQSTSACRIHRLAYVDFPHFGETMGVICELIRFNYLPTRTAFFTSALIFASSTAVNFFSAKASLTLALGRRWRSRPTGKPARQPRVRLSAFVRPCYQLRSLNQRVLPCLGPFDFLPSGGLFRGFRAAALVAFN